MAGGQIKLEEGDTGNYAGFEAPTSLTSDVIWKLPATDGTAGQSLVTDGNKNLSWSGGKLLVIGIDTGQTEQVFTFDKNVQITKVSFVSYEATGGYATDFRVKKATTVGGSYSDIITGSKIAGSSSTWYNTNITSGIPQTIASTDFLLITYGNGGSNAYINKIRAHIYYNVL